MAAKRTVITLLLAAFASFVWAVAPAQSSKAGAPAATADFTQALPKARQLAKPSPKLLRQVDRDGYGVDGPIIYRTAPVSAPRSFDFVGVQGEMRALEFRARSEGEAWSDWVEADNGDPVYTGGTDEVQVRSRGVPIEGRLHYVKVSDEQTALGDKLRASSKPQFIGRARWGANQPKAGCRPREKAEYGKVKAGVVHHTVSTNTYTEAQAPSIVLGICRFHRNSNGWNDIGYNALVDRFGNLYAGRAGGLNKAVVGAQVEGFNSQTTGVATIADHRVKKATAAETEAVVSYLAWKLSGVGLDGTGNSRLLSAGGSSNQTKSGERIKVKQVVGHGDLGFTECPGDALYQRIGKIRRLVQERIAEGGGEGPVDPADPDTPPSGGASP